MTGIPREPKFGILLADGRPQQVERPLREGLCLFHPRDVEALETLDALGRVVLHAVEDDNAVVRSLDAGIEDMERIEKVIFIELVFDESLDGLRERALNLTDADGAARLKEAAFDELVCKKMRLSAAAPAMNAFVAARA